MSDKTYLAENDYLFVLGIDLGQPSFVHAVLAVQALDYAGNHGRNNQSDHKSQLLNVEIHIGNSSDWSQNPKCAGGPFLDPDDPDVWYYCTGTDGEMDLWPNGIEQWCNMEGQYVTIVADYNSVKDAYSTLEPSICDLGIFGTRYIRDQEAPTSV